MNNVARTLLIGSPGTSWRAWLKDHRGKRDLLVLDPSDPDHGQLGRLTLLRGEKAVASRFYGSLEPSRAPHVLIAALAQILPASGEDAIVQLFPARGGPLVRHLLLLLSEMIRPEEILVPQGAGLELDGYPVGPHEVELEKAFPETVRSAQRKANWLKLLEQCEEHELDISRVSVQGARLGSGRIVRLEQLEKLGIEEPLHGEVSGGTLFIIAEEEPPDHVMARALDVFHCGRAHIVPPGSYNGLLCSFARQDGEDFGTGMIQSIDFGTQTAKILCDAVAPAPVRILKLGGLKVDTAGREMGEVRPWQV